MLLGRQCGVLRYFAGQSLQRDVADSDRRVAVETSLEALMWWWWWLLTLRDPHPDLFLLGEPGAGLSCPLCYINMQHPLRPNVLKCPANHCILGGCRLDGTLHLIASNAPGQVPSSTPHARLETLDAGYTTEALVPYTPMDGAANTV